MQRDRVVIAAGDTIAIDNEIWRLHEIGEVIALFNDSGLCAFAMPGTGNPPLYEHWIASSLDLNDYQYLIVVAPNGYPGYCDIVACERDMDREDADGVRAFNLEHYQFLDETNLEHSLDSEIASFLDNV